MSALAFVRCLRAENDVARLWFYVQLAQYTWAGIGRAPWVYQHLKRWVGEADVRSAPIDWRRLVEDLRNRGYRGKLPRSLRQFEPPSLPAFGDWAGPCA